MHIRRRTSWLSVAALVAAAAVGLAFIAQGRSGLPSAEVDKGVSTASKPADAKREDVAATSSDRDRLSAAPAPNLFNRGRATHPLYFAEIKAAAMSGDPRAQRELADMYGECMAYSHSPQALMATLDALAGEDPGSAGSIVPVKERKRQLCSFVEDGQAIPYETYALWLDAAAESGDVVSRIRRQVRSSDRLTSEQYASFADAAIQSGDPQALFELGNMLATAPSDQGVTRYTNVSGTAYAGYAWEIVACRSGLPCGSGTALMDSVCINTGACGYSNYEDFVFSALVPAGDRHRMDRLIDEVGNLVN